MFGQRQEGYNHGYKGAITPLTQVIIMVISYLLSSLNIQEQTEPL